MELKSNFDFKTLRKAQSKTQAKFNRAAKSIEKLGLDEADVKTIEAILTKKFDAELGDIMKNGATAPAAEGGGFV